MKKTPFEIFCTFVLIGFIGFMQPILLVLYAAIEVKVMLTAPTQTPEAYNRENLPAWADGLGYVCVLLVTALGGLATYRSEPTGWTILYCVIGIASVTILASTDFRRRRKITSIPCDPQR